MFTTRPDTIFGVSYMTLALEHEYVSRITTDEFKAAVQQYVDQTKKRSERDRMSDVKTVSGQFTGAYVKILLQVRKFLFGLVIMCWQVMELVLLWLFRP